MASKAKTDGKLKFVTGFCANKQCEGTKPKASVTGTPMKTCDFWETCPCKCHAQITEMYELAGMDREPPEQSAEYLAWVREQRHQFVVPSLYDSDPMEPLSSPDGTDTPDADERPVATPPNGAQDPTSAPAPVVPVPSFAPTPTGRRARGQLEYDVLAVCIDFAANVYEWEICTPKLVAERIGKINETEPPSTGAINAVWDRWEKLGFAVQDKKPSRFVEFSVMMPSPAVLERLKNQRKREKKRTQAEIKRGSLRPRGR